MTLAVGKIWGRAGRPLDRGPRISRTETTARNEIGNRQWDIPQFRPSLETIISGRKTIEAFEVEHFFPPIGRRTVMLNARTVYPPHNKIRRILTGWLQCQPDNRSKR